MQCGEANEFVSKHADAEWLGNGKIRCTTTGHEMLATLSFLESHWGGKAYRRAKAAAGYDFSQHEPHLVPHTRDPHLMWCTVTQKPVSRQPRAIEAHVQGRRFKRLLELQARPASAKETAPPSGGGEEGECIDDNEEALEDWGLALNDDAQEAELEAEVAPRNKDGRCKKRHVVVAVDQKESLHDDDDGDEADAFWVRPKAAKRKGKQPETLIVTDSAAATQRKKRKHHAPQSKAHSGNAPSTISLKTLSTQKKPQAFARADV